MKGSQRIELIKWACPTGRRYKSIAEWLETVELLNMIIHGSIPYCTKLYPAIVPDHPQGPQIRVCTPCTDILRDPVRNHLQKRLRIFFSSIPPRGREVHQNTGCFHNNYTLTLHLKKWPLLMCWTFSGRGKPGPEDEDDYRARHVSICQCRLVETWGRLLISH